MIAENKYNRQVAIWLLTGAGMIIIQVLLGGITRLTGSGLSITEWKPLLGALPPMNEHDWLQAFEKYKQLAQFKYIHNYFTLTDFKHIYFWEWLHRNWARLMSVVFAIPFIYFVVTRKINKTMLWPMVILFLLGGLQGLVGWVMVSSGVGTELVYVDHVRLAVHFISALLLLCYVVWFALKLLLPVERLPYKQGLKRFTIGLLVLLTLQLIYGAFMAGTHAGNAAITWPSINGSYFPADLSDHKDGLLHNITNNLISIQFVHRTLAYILAILIIVYTVKLYREPSGTALAKFRNWPLLLVLAQVLLGIFTVTLYLTPNKFLLSILHQFTGMLLLVCLVVGLYLTGSMKKAGNQL